MNVSQPTAVAWRKSSFSGITDCVEVALSPDEHVLVRDSKDPDGTSLAVPPETWRDFLQAIRMHGL